MNHEGEIEPLSRLVRPHVAIITTIAPVHLEFLGSLAKIANAKAEIFFGVEPGGAAVLNRDIAQFAQLKRRAKEAGIARIVSFGEHAAADARVDQMRVAPALLDGRGAISSAHEFSYKIGAPGRHLVINSLAVLAAVELVGADLALRGAGACRTVAGKPAAARRSGSICPAVRRSSSTIATMPIRPRSTRRLRYSARRRSARAAGASPSSATCSNSGQRAAPCIAPWSIRCSPMRSIWCSAVAR